MTACTRGASKTPSQSPPAIPETVITVSAASPVAQQPAETRLPTAAVTPQPPTPTPTTANSPTPAPLETQPDEIPATIDAACMQAGNAQVELHQIDSALLPKPLQFRVFLPPCYVERPETFYPVLYLFHGQFSNDDQWDRLGVDETAARLIASGKMPPFLIVLPYDRERDKESDESMYDESIIQELLPFVENNYRVLPDRAFRAIGGLSRGAGWALHIGMTFDTLFGAIGLHSPAIFWADTPHIPAWLDSAETKPLPRLYIDLGDHDSPQIVDSAMWFESNLTRRNIEHDFHLFPGYHVEDYWQAHMENYLLWYAANW